MTYRQRGIIFRRSVPKYCHYELHCLLTLGLDLKISGVFLFVELIFNYSFDMPKVRRSKRPPPDGWELIEPTLEELEQKMREGGL